MSDTNLTVYGFADLSEITGMSTSTLSTLLHRGRKNRALGKHFPNDIPEPDGKFGTSPVWRHETVQEWLTERASGEGAARVKRAVDPEKSLSSGKAVPVEPKPRAPSKTAETAAKNGKPATAEIPPVVETAAPAAVRETPVVSESKSVVDATPSISAGKGLLNKLRTLRGRR
ncbi:MAG: hypothetical protein E6R04_10860 [Spirochaetes bacterium]|nr:MAG: hypothetical protein E6R04_10860 [Spirochaetota bacterium]